MRARRFAEAYTTTSACSRWWSCTTGPIGSGSGCGVRGTWIRQVDTMLARIPDLPLFVRFVELDGSTEGKRPEPIEWLREEIVRRGLDPG